MKFKNSVLQDPRATTKATQPLAFSGFQSGLQSARMSQNQTPEASNNIPLHLLQNPNKIYSPYQDAIPVMDQASLYFAHEHNHPQQPSLIINNFQHMDSQQPLLADQHEEENTFDFLGSYQSDKDEDYSEKEDLIMNKKFYAKDLTKPFEKNISKAEVQCLLKDQIPSDGYPGVDESSIMPLPYNMREKDRLIGKRNYYEFSQKESIFDNGYAEYLF